METIDIYVEVIKILKDKRNEALTTGQLAAKITSMIEREVVSKMIKLIREEQEKNDG
jgi:hypothetical protein